MIAALFVESGGCYFGSPDVDAWDIERDARKYTGPHPVVAHPPCQRWGRLGAANYHRWGGEHNRPGNDEGCFASALESVRRFGGVLEHPARSHAWATFRLQPPPTLGWTRSGEGWTCKVWQSAYGHKANKSTWLYYVGESVPFELDWSRPVGTHQVGFQDQRRKERNKPVLSKRDANATPPAFRDVLIRLAQSSRPNSLLGGLPPEARDHRTLLESEKADKLQGEIVRLTIQRDNLAHALWSAEDQWGSEHLWEKWGLSKHLTPELKQELLEGPSGPTVEVEKNG